jgi:hypothetical protein
MIGWVIVTRRFLLAVTTTALILTACGGDDAPTAAESEPDPAATDVPEDEPTAPARTVTFTEPIETVFECDCPSVVVGSNGVDRVAIVRSLPGPSMTDDQEPATLQVLDSNGELAWDFDELPQIFDGGPGANGVTAYPSGVVVEGEDQTLIGLDWSDGSKLWDLPNVSVTPEQVRGQDDVFILAGQLFGQVDGESYTSHPRVSLVDVESGGRKWTAEDVDKYAVSRDGSYLVIARFDDDAAELTKVDVADGAETTVSVPSWTGAGWSLTIDDDDVIAAHFGASGERERQQVAVDWAAGSTEDVPEADESDSGPRVPGHPDATRVDSDDDLDVVLAATLDDDGVPTTAFAVDAAGGVLWEKPAAEVTSWRTYVSEQTGEDRTSMRSLSLRPAGAADPVAVVDARPVPFEEVTGGVGTNASGPAYAAFDAMTGDELWTWGDRSRLGGITYVPEHGLAFVSEGGVAGDGDDYFSDATAEPLNLELIDLRTGEADWTVTGDETRSGTAWTDGTFAIVHVDGPWLMSVRADR